MVGVGAAGRRCASDGETALDDGLDPAISRRWRPAALRMPNRGQ